MLRKSNDRNCARTRARVFANSLVVLLIGVGTHAVAAGANRLEKIDTQVLPGDRVEVKLQLTDSAPQPLSFTVDNPARISLDLADTTIALPSRRIDVKRGVLDTVNAAEAGGRTRVVLNLDKLVPYETRVDGNAIYVTMAAAGSGSAIASAATPRAVSSSRARSDASASMNHAINNVDFRRGTDGSGRIVVDLTDSKVAADMKQEGGRVIVTFPKTTLPDSLMRRLDVVDFATPVNTVDVVRAAEGARLIVAANGDWEPVAYQSDNVYTIEIKPVVKLAQNLQDKKEYTGERLTLNFQDIETRAVLQLLADTSGQNMVISDSVQGNVTLRLQNVPWDQALDIVMRTKGLDMRHEGNVMLVAPAPEIAAREKELLASRKEISEIAPLRTEYLQVNYAKASDLAKLIKAAKGNSLLSERGNVSIDERTNTLLLQDTSDRLADIRKLVATLDIPVRQVLIEARIVIVNDDFSRDLGVRLGVTGKQANGSNGLYALTGTAAGTDTMISSAITNLGTNGTVNPVAVPTGAAASNRYMVNLPAANPAGSLALSVLSSDYIVDLELSAAQAEGKGEVVSSPRVITANQKEATIEQGVEIPYQESSSSGATTTQFKKAVLSLKVTPQITPDNRVILDLAVNKDSVGQNVASATGGFVPSIDTRKILTQVLVNDGQTVVLGGILETEKRDTENKVPLLGDIPVLGHLFKSSNKTNNKDELLIFITPKIMREGSSIY